MTQLKSNRRFDAVLSDVDGCMLDEAGGPLNIDALAWIADYNRRAVAHGDRPVVTLCTGRPVSFADCLCRLIHNMELPCIAENGVWLYHPGTNEWRIDPDITHDQREATLLMFEWLTETYGNDGLTIQAGKAASVSPYHPDPTFLRNIEPEVRKHCEEQGWPFRISSTWNYINCDLAHISKASGIRRWREMTGIPAERCAGIGDTLHDKMIAESVDYFACPANRHEGLDERARYISPKREIEGVIDILKKLIGPDAPLHG